MANLSSLPIGNSPFPVDINKPIPFSTFGSVEFLNKLPLSAFGGVVNFNPPIPFGSSSGIIENGSDGSFCDVKKGNCWWQH